MAGRAEASWVPKQNQVPKSKIKDEHPMGRRRKKWGCFVFKPNFKKRKISVPIEDYFNKGKDESEDSKLRFETYHLIWQQMKSETERLQEELNKNLFDSLIEFLQKSHSGFQKNLKDWGSQIKLREIPAAALVLGVNLVSQLMDCCVDVESKEEESVQVTQKKTHYSMDSLSSWYMNVTQKTDPKMPRKKRTSRQWQSPPVVLILKDMESFTTKVLQDFIIISSQHLHEFPLILIFGIATSPIIIHWLLPHALLLTTQFPFKLSEKVLQILTNIFLYHDFSIQNFIKGLQKPGEEYIFYQITSVKTSDVFHHLGEQYRKSSNCNAGIANPEFASHQVLHNYLWACVFTDIFAGLNYNIDYMYMQKTQPLHEVVYFSAAHTLREHLNAAPRVALHTALNNPYYYLKNEALRSEEGCIPNVAPDICIAYKLHLECSRLINLVDWSEAFATVVTAAEKLDANSITSEERNEII
ncbi:hypothetical protein HPG69_014220, partial [Diceros bicornis minor]